MNVQEKFAITQSELCSGLVERDEEVGLVLTSLLCNQHCLLVGDPGTGKSLLADSVADWISGNVFKILINKTTVPDELFGPVSLTSMKRDEYRRLTTHKLPEADVAFLDEIFKGSSAINNSMLKILNERKYENGIVTQACPLRICIAASNEWPTEAKELGALFDRFLFRKSVASVTSSDGVSRLMYDGDLGPKLSTSLTIAELNEAQIEIRDLVVWSSDARDAAEEIRKALLREGIIVGGRRLRQSALACRCYAWLNGRKIVTKDDLYILSAIWWLHPESQPQIVMDKIAEIARPARLEIAMLLADAQDIMASVDLKDYGTHAVATHKLVEIHKKLKGNSHPQAGAAMKSIAEMVTKIQKASIAVLE